MGQQPDATQQQQQFDQVLLAAAKASTAPDTFKGGDVLAGGRCVGLLAVLRPLLSSCCSVHQHTAAVII
jgi:hypothetical protein